LIPHEDKVDFITPFNILMFMMMMMMMMMTMMMMMMMMVMIMMIVSVEQRPGWAEHVKTI